MTKFAILFNIFMFDQDAKVDISLWGYRETSIEPELVCALLLSFQLYFFFFKIFFVLKRCISLNWGQVKPMMDDFKFSQQTSPIMMMDRKQDRAGGWR